MSRLNLIDMFGNESAETFNKCSKAYELGRSDEYQEIVSEYMLLTEKQVADIRAEAIDECIRQVLEAYGKYPFELGFVLTAIEELKKED